MAADRRRLTVSLSVADWENLEAEALASGVKIGTYAGRLLTDHVNPSARGTRIPQRQPALGKAMTAAEWERLAAWFLDKGHDPRREGCKTKQDAMRWARANGYDA